MGNGIVIVGLNQFRADLRRAQGAYPRVLTAAIRKAGFPIIARAHAITPRVSGRLAGGWRVSVRGTTGSITSSVPYSGGAVWGVHGKWSGFSGVRPRYVDPEANPLPQRIQDILDRELRGVLEAYGWFHL